MRPIGIGLLIAMSFTLFSPSAHAEEPVMNTIPRWKNGYGFQVRQEHRYSSKLLNDDSRQSNPSGRRLRVDTTWFEAVYTLDPRIRFTFKYPYVHQTRYVMQNGVRVRQSDSGFGDLILGMPLKKYIDWKGGSQSIGFIPRIQLPTGSTRSDFSVGDGSTDVGFSLVYNMETLKIYQNYDLFYWLNNKGTSSHQGDIVGLDAELGLRIYDNFEKRYGLVTNILMEARHEEKGYDATESTGSMRLALGPSIMAYWHNALIHFKYKVPVYEHVDGTQFAFGHEFTLMFGMAF